MYYNLGCSIVGYCEALDEEEVLGSQSSLVCEDLQDALPYLFEEHFEIPFSEVGYLSVSGARKWYSDLEKKWLKNELDLSYLYHDEDFLNYLRDKKFEEMSYDDILELADDFKESLKDKLDWISKEHLKELKDEYGDSIEFNLIRDDNEQNVYWGEVDLPELAYDEDEEEDDE